MGNNLNVVKQKAEERIAKRIEETGDHTLSFPDHLLALTQLPAHEIRRRLLAPDSQVNLPELFQLFHYAKQLERNSHNAMTDVFYFEPLAESYKLQRLIDTKKTAETDKLPLLGFVLSIKDYMALKNTDSTWGYAFQFNNPVSETAPLFLHLKKQGAVFACKGNVPQLLMTFESINNVFGPVKNLYNPERTTGGSSGGEAAAIQLGLVNAGIGSDIGGSIRIPALFSGLWGFKPTAGRIDYSNTTDLFHDHPAEGKVTDTQFVIFPTLGPLARSARDCTTLMKAMNDYSQTTWVHLPLPWKEEKAPTRVGWIAEFSEHFKLPDCCTRVFNEAKALLEGAGVELVEVDISHLVHDAAMTTYTAFMSDKLGEDIFLGNTPIVEPHIEAYNEAVDTMAAPVSTLKSLQKSSLMSVHQKFLIEAALRARSVNAQSLMVQKAKLIDAVCDAFKKANVEVALTYGLFPAPRHDQTENLVYPMLYTCIWNLLNLPTGAVPISKVRKDEQYYEGQVGDKIDHHMELTMTDSVGLPLGVQVVGLPWREEAVLAAMELMEDLLLKPEGEAVQ